MSEEGVAAVVRAAESAEAVPAYDPVALFGCDPATKSFPWLKKAMQDKGWPFEVIFRCKNKTALVELINSGPSEKAEEAAPAKTAAAKAAEDQAAAAKAAEDQAAAEKAAAAKAAKELAAVARAAEQEEEAAATVSAEFAADEAGEVGAPPKSPEQLAAVAKAAEDEEEATAAAAAAAEAAIKAKTAQKATEIEAAVALVEYSTEEDTEEDEPEEAEPESLNPEIQRLETLILALEPAGAAMADDIADLRERIHVIRAETDGTAQQGKSNVIQNAIDDAMDAETKAAEVAAFARAAEEAAAVRVAEPTKQESDEIFEIFDIDSDGCVDMDELLEMVAFTKKTASGALDRAQIQQMWDLDGAGKVC